MYRLLVLLVVLAAVDCHCGGGCSWRKSHNKTRIFGKQQFIDQGTGSTGRADPEKLPGTFEDIAENMKLIDRALKKFCAENNMIQRTSELFGLEHYILKYRLPEFNETDVEVKIMNRIIYTTADSKNGTTKPYKDIRILPSHVDTTRASWVYEQQMVKVFIPYLAATGSDEMLYCNGGSEEVKEVPNMKFNNIEVMGSTFKQ